MTYQVHQGEDVTLKPVAGEPPRRVQLSRAKGWRMPENTVKVARPGVWGNPYRVSTFGLQLAIHLYRESVSGFWSPSNVAHLSDEDAAEAYRCHTKIRRRMQGVHIGELRGKNLACWCKLGEPCHADVLLELANPDAAAIRRLSGQQEGK